MSDSAVPANEPRPPKPRGGRRPGAGAPRGNLNGLKNGRYSAQIQALQSAIDAMPQTADVIDAMLANDKRHVEKLAHALRYYSEMLLLKTKRDAIKKRANSIKKGGVSIKKNEQTQIRDILKFANLIKQSK